MVRVGEAVDKSMKGNCANARLERDKFNLVVTYVEEIGFTSQICWQA